MGEGERCRRDFSLTTSPIKQGGAPRRRVGRPLCPARMGGCPASIAALVKWLGSWDYLRWMRAVEPLVLRGPSARGVPYCKLRKRETAPKGRPTSRSNRPLFDLDPDAVAPMAMTAARLTPAIIVAFLPLPVVLHDAELQSRLVPGLTGDAPAISSSLHTTAADAAPAVIANTAAPRRVATDLTAAGGPARMPMNGNHRIYQD